MFFAYKKAMNSKIKNNKKLYGKSTIGNKKKYCEKHDSFFLIKKDQWLDKSCKDNTCDLCQDQQNKPSEVIIDRSDFDKNNIIKQFQVKDLENVLNKCGSESIIVNGYLGQYTDLVIDIKTLYQIKSKCGNYYLDKELIEDFKIHEDDIIIGEVNCIIFK